MNERIQKLAEQTGFRYDNGEWQFGDDSDVEKFAQLIVRECADICFTKWRDNGDSYGILIKQHFGVEE